MVRVRTTVIAAVAFGFVIGLHASDRPAVKNSRQACAKLLEAAVTYRLSLHNLTGRYYCDVTGHDEENFIMGLRYRVRPNELVGSNLLGWYAIRRTDGKVFGWDINESVTTPLEMGPPFVADDERSVLPPPNKSLERARDR